MIIQLLIQFSMRNETPGTKWDTYNEMSHLELNKWRTVFNLTRGLEHNLREVQSCIQYLFKTKLTPSNMQLIYFRRNLKCNFVVYLFKWEMNFFYNNKLLFFYFYLYVIRICLKSFLGGRSSYVLYGYRPVPRPTNSYNVPKQLSYGPIFI